MSAIVVVSTNKVHKTHQSFNCGGGGCNRPVVIFFDYQGSLNMIQYSATKINLSQCPVKLQR